MNTNGCPSQGAVRQGRVLNRRKQRKQRAVGAATPRIRDKRGQARWRREKEEV